ncbi:WXG100 family type VII secretion target [Kitasatospora sp. NPDC097643]|uniref:WXG100 family type VII secretion target n=1 Tax=Kitasatospora sp. NPDC097643 TaxID=3157230 RepID=UPI0033245386
MGQFTMTAQEMLAFAKQIDDAIQKIDAERTKLNGTVTNVTGGWKGQAATAYTNLQTQFNQDIDALNQSLRAIKGAIEETTRRYSLTEQDQQQQFTAAQG